MNRLCACALTAGSLIALAAAGCPPAGGGGTETNFTANLTGAQEIPPVTTNATGSGTFTLNAAQTELSYNVPFSGLSGPLTLAHFHRGAAGVEGPPVFTIPLVPGVQGTLQGTWVLTAADAADLMAGNIYVNLHTALNPDGEIRGQLTRN
jgi:hypothetical protein